MRKTIFITVLFCLLAVSAFAQNKPDFSGIWELDAGKSKLDERMRVESMTLTVTQTDKELTTVTTTKRTVSSEGGAMNRGGGMSGDGQVMKYSLEGKETEAQVGGGMMAGKATLKVSLYADGKLKLSSVRNVSTQMGDFAITTKETWELTDEGKTLKISRTSETPRGTNSSELIFTKKETTSVTNGEIIASSTGSSSAMSPQAISGGVLNSKANPLVKPEYPAAARAVRASGAVSVQVTIDEEGNVISAEAVSGHPLLRGASVEAAKKSKFRPTLLSGTPVKVTGIIVYNFVP